MSKYTGGRLADGTPLNKAVYQAFKNAGLSHNQALAVTAEVGRENGFAAKYIFGGHIDPAGAKGGGTIQNVGFLSWNGTRGTNLKKYLASQGVMSNGRMRRTQEALNAQARFAVQEMKGAYRGKLTHFWNNPNANPESFAKELGRGYIVWAYGQNTIRGKNGGRVPFNWQAHDGRRRGHLNTLAGMVGGGGNYQPQKSTGPKASDTLFFGDSIAHGYRTANNMGGATKVGANPRVVLAQLQNALKNNPNAFRGKNIVLSSGYSNGNDLANIEKQLQLLQKAGANVSLLGVSNSFNIGGRAGKTMNTQLGTLAQKYGADFRGGFVAGADNVHPKSYRGFVMPSSPITHISPHNRQPVQAPQPQFITGDELKRLLPQAFS